ncbi:hypothetical protein J7L27_03345 [Candidatus Bathyarchaeota archaeon]|nr:hypothetical protein [Candidatus Bathyarchaeota archaeon]
MKAKSQLLMPAEDSLRKGREQTCFCWIDGKRICDEKCVAYDSAAPYRCKVLDILESLYQAIHDLMEEFSQ